MFKYIDIDIMEIKDYAKTVKIKAMKTLKCVFGLTFRDLKLYLIFMKYISIWKMKIIILKNILQKIN